MRYVASPCSSSWRSQPCRSSFRQSAVYGVTAASVAARNREIGVRIALGARRYQVLGSVIGEALMLAGIGLLGGLLLGVMFSSVLEGMVFDVSPRDPLSTIAGMLVLLAAAVFASLPSALRASRLDPLAALREE